MQFDEFMGCSIKKYVLKIGYYDFGIKLLSVFARAIVNKITNIINEI